MIEKILCKSNIQKAFKRVVANKGSCGVDGVSVNELKPYLKTQWEQIRTAVMDAKYCPDPILGVMIPKSNGKERLLGIPTVKDRLLQQAVCQILSDLYDPTFQDHSYGFRPKRNAHQAVKQARQNINDGYADIIDIDLSNFFDQVSHDVMLNLLHRKVKCVTTLRLICKWLKAPIQLNGGLEKRTKGVPQGSPLSPLLSNILLNELDKELEKRDHRWVRYADDFSIYLQNKQSAQKVKTSIVSFLKVKLFLPINQSKSGIRKPINFKILGYGFVPVYKKGVKGKYQLVVDHKALKGFKSKIKWLTRKTTPIGLEDRILRLNRLTRGWLNYFKLANISGKLNKIDGWIRNRLRYCIWHHWKKPIRKVKNLIRLGIPYDMAMGWGRTRMGGWRVACSPILRTTITEKRLEKRGYISLKSIYSKLTDA
jgi:group II intron reverse transcriptase/maturase|tara:strand:+ start:564 stop:1838 length:1275 start_codon:yes stop_codon:yes gene_type:complete